jgi:hypothetical protein
LQEHHFAIFVLDPEARRLEVQVIADEQWLEPVQFEPGGRVSKVLPPWYPQLGERPSTRVRKPDEVTNELQQLCVDRGVNWAELTVALREWCSSQLDDLADVEWLYLPGTSAEPSHVRCLMGDVRVHAATDAYSATFTSSDGRLRRIDVNDVARAEAIFRRVGLNPADANPIIERWLSLAYRLGSQDRRAQGVNWHAGYRKWNFAIQVGVVAPMRGVKHAAGVCEDDPFPRGWLPLLLSWLF